jgi:hypothetical protein
MGAVEPRATPPWISVLLPDSQWYDVDEGTLIFGLFAEATELRGTPGYRFKVQGVEYRVPASSILAAKGPP